MSQIIYKKWDINLLSQIKCDKLIYVVDECLGVKLPKESIVLECKAGEDLKAFSMLEKALDFFLDHGVTRKTHLIAIGGGSVSDFAGLVASLLLRGISWSVVPTTLLSMVDASIGGKTAINTNQGKNLIGTFHLPDTIFIDDSFLMTLPKVEIESGRGEVLKYSFLSEEVYQNVISQSSWQDIIKSCADYKSDVVKKDLNEGGLRKLLNLGHTFGHAIEKSNRLPHGIAVVLGIEVILGLYGEKSLMVKFDHLKKNLELDQVFIRNISLNTKDILNYLKNDKKNVGHGEIDLIIPSDIGDVKVVKKSMVEVHSDFEKYCGEKL